MVKDYLRTAVLKNKNSASPQQTKKWKFAYTQAGNTIYLDNIAKPQKTSLIEKP